MIAVTHPSRTPHRHASFTPVTLQDVCAGQTATLTVTLRHALATVTFPPLLDKGERASSLVQPEGGRKFTTSRESATQPTSHRFLGGPFFPCAYRECHSPGEWRDRFCLIRGGRRHAPNAARPCG